MSNENYQHNPISEITITANSIELDIDKNYIIPNMNGEVAFLLHKPEAKQLVTMLNEFLMYQNGNGPTGEDPNDVLLDKLIKMDSKHWQMLVEDFKNTKDITNNPNAPEFLKDLTQSMTATAMASFETDIGKHLSKKENKQIRSDAFITDLTKRLDKEANKLSKNEAE